MIFSTSRAVDLKERVGIAEALASDHLGISNKAIPPVGANAALTCALQEEGDERCCVMDGIHCQQVQISKACNGTGLFTSYQQYFLLYILIVYETYFFS